MGGRIEQNSWNSGFDVVSDAVCIVDREGKILRCNEAMAELVSKPSTEIVGTPCHEALNCNHLMLDSCPTRRMLQTERRESSVIENPAGQLPVIVEPLRDCHGEVAGALHVVALSSSQSSVGEVSNLYGDRLCRLGLLAGTLAHDFGNLLSGIMCHAELTLMHIEQDHSCRQSIDQIRLAAQRAIELTHDLVEQHQLLDRPEKTKALALPDILDEVVRMIAVRVPDKISLQRGVSDDVPPIMGDSAQIRRLITNLALNAIESIEGKGSVTIRCEISNIDKKFISSCFKAIDLSPGPYVVLETVDTGKGMDEQTIANAFLPYSSSKSSKRGLGLASVLQVVRNHRGALHVISQPGKGTSIKVLFSPAI